MSDTAKALADLRPFVDRTRRGRARRGAFFSLCLKASLAKAYDFAVYVHTQKLRDGSFFVAGTLRGICEDLIVLGFLSRLPHADRDTVAADLMMHETLTKISTQATFFRTLRPHQAVLGPSDATQARCEALEAAIRGIWARHGWSLSRGTLPQVRQLAERQGSTVLAVLYEFLYRFTSGMVHFSPQVLLRSGWGKKPWLISFAPRNFDQYYLAFARTYSVYLLCLYFEMFQSFLRPTRAAGAAARILRHDLRLRVRWPEMVTYEEMNVPVPDPPFVALLARIVEAESSKGKAFLRAGARRRPRG